MSYQWQEPTQEQGQTQESLACLDYSQAQQIAEHEAASFEFFLGKQVFYDENSHEYSYEQSKENHELLTSLYAAFIAKRFGLVRS